MFCPRCSQEQISEEIKFCSRCGLPLSVVSKVLTNGGFLPQPADETKNKKWLTRKKGLLFSMFWFMFFVLVMTPIVAIDNGDDAFVMAILGIMGGLIMTVASFIFLKNEPRSAENFKKDSANYKTKNLYESQHTALPPQQTQPAQNYVSPAHSWKAPVTGEMVQPQSVTEATTRLLKKEG
jgi:hypothetical protein